MDVTIPEKGDLLFPRIPVEAIRAYSVGRLWFTPETGVDLQPELAADDGRRVRVDEVLIDGEWVPL